MSAQNLSSIGEFGLIRWLERYLSSSAAGAVRSIGDDTAVLPYKKGQVLLWSTDMLLEGRHFTARMRPQDIGHKALASSISDIAAMGGSPWTALVSLGISGRKSSAYAKALYQGMRKAAGQFNVEIVGGDTVSSAKTIINVTLLGKARSKDVVYRSGAKAGHHIFVSGPLGGSFKSGRHLRFKPRVNEASYLVKHCRPSAMLDISDGLAADLNHICAASSLGAELREDDIPLHQGANLQQALSEGEDFELLFTVPPRQALRLKEHKGQYRFYDIGVMTKARTLKRIDSQGRRKNLKPKGYQHF